jgi:uncharacterized protein YcnI
MKHSARALLCGTFVVTWTGFASAHISVSGPGFANTTQEITFGVGHGCEGADTLSVRVEIPSEVASVRALRSDLGPATLELDDAGLVVAVTWAKPEAELLDADTSYYRLPLRIRVPDAPFTILYFPAHQVCQTSSGETIEVDWASTTPNEGEGGEEPAPALKILPKRFPGWNKFTVSKAITDLSSFFSDALIVWKEEAAYSPNPATAELIAGTRGVSDLTRLDADDEIWVKY